MDGAGNRFADGETARVRSVSARLEGERLVVFDAADGVPVADWRTAALRRVGPRGRGPRLVLSSAAAPDARLTIEDASLAAALVAVRPDLFAPAALRRAVLWTAAALAGIAATGLLIGFGVPAAAERIAEHVPASWERRLGEAVIGQMRSAFTQLTGHGAPCIGAPGREALAALTRRLAGALDPPPAAETLVLDVGIVNAFAAPGGRIVVLRGLIENARTPDELAGVLAHEIGHVHHHHATKALIRSLGSGLLMDLVTGGGAGGLGGAARTVVGLSYGREAEAEADETALAALAAAGISAKGLARFFERQAARSPGEQGMGSILSSHPSSAVRAALARSAPDGAPGLTPEEWRAVKALCKDRG